MGAEFLGKMQTRRNCATSRPTIKTQGTTLEVKIIAIPGALWYPAAA